MEEQLELFHRANDLIQEEVSRLNKERFRDDVEEATKQLLKAMEKWAGVDITNPNFTDTPARVGRAYTEILDGLFNSDAKIKDILSKKFPFTAETSEMIVVGPIHTWSLCAHHLAPVELNIWVGYLPEKYVLGLSKLARLSELISKKPGLQEDVTSEIADQLSLTLQSKGSGCYIRGRHLCMAMRGVRQDAITTTTQLRGDFLKAEVRNEFLSSVRTDIGYKGL